MKQTFLFLLLSFLSFNAFSQEKVRYISYPNTKKNAVLFENEGNLSFRNVVVGYLENKFDKRQLKSGGISKSDQKLIEKAIGGKLSENKQFRYVLGPQGFAPLKNSYGEDSTIRNSYGETEYRYPDRDTIYFSFDYDELIVKEVWKYSSVLENYTFYPDEILFRKKFKGLNEAVTTAAINFETFLEEGIIQKGYPLSDSIH